MFREVYKSANDDIIPDSQLLDNILAQQHKRNSHFYSTYYKYGSVAAAFLILIGTLVIYPKMSDTLNSTQDKADEVVSITESFDLTTPTPTLRAETEIASTDFESTKNAAKSTKPVISATPQNIKTEAPPMITASPTPIASEAVLDGSNANTEATTDYSVMAANEVFEEAPAYSPEEAEEAASSGGGSLAKSRMLTEYFITEEDAKQIADRIFFEDFGEEFLNSTEIKVVKEEHFNVTRYNEECSYTVTVFDDGAFERQYIKGE